MNIIQNPQKKLIKSVNTYTVSTVVIREILHLTNKDLVVKWHLIHIYHKNAENKINIIYYENGIIYGHLI